MIRNVGKSKYVSVETVEEFILNYGALPPEMDSWRCYRLEYFGNGPYDIFEVHLYVPPMFDRDALERLFEKAQRPLIMRLWKWFVDYAKQLTGWM